MLCKQANSLLIDFAERNLDGALHQQVEAHMSDCKVCQEDYESITAFTHMANSWHDELPPAWTPPKMAATDWLESFRMWFPTAASTAALAMAALIFVQLPETQGSLPTGSTMAENYQDLPQLPKATQAAMVQSVMDGSREQRQQELQALLKILKAEMDKRSIQTEESLRFVITNQLQGQQELDDLYKQVEAMMTESQQADGTTPLNIEGVSQ